MNRIRVLIIEENPIVRTALATRLGTMPEIEVMASAGNVLDIERLIQQTQPDVVLVEPKRLACRGIPLIQALTAIPRPPLVIVLTSYHDENEEMVAHELGISHYMLKEIDSRALVNAIVAAHRASSAPGALTS